MLYEAKILKKLAYASDAKLGAIAKNKIQRIMDLYNILGLYKNKINIDKFIYKIPHKFYLTTEETRYLKDKKSVKMCIDPDWMPFEKIDKGRHIGMVADFFELIREEARMNVELVKTNSWDESIKFVKERKCDILSLAMSTPEREKYLNFTDSYLKIPLVMATKTEVPFVNDFHMLTNKKLGIPKGYAFAELLKVKYPNLTIVEVKNINDGLKKVVQGELYGYVGTLASIGYAFQTNFTGELKIAGKFDGTWDLGIGVRNDDPVLFNILQKAVNAIDKDARQKILNTWLAINYVKETDYALLFEAIAIFTFILLIVLFFYMKLVKLKKQLELLASTDPMTKIYNRRYFSEISERILDLTKRNKTDLSLIMLDIDNFKHINDSYGHKVGDDVIVSFAQTLLKLSRKSDIYSNILKNKKVNIRYCKISNK